MGAWAVVLATVALAGCSTCPHGEAHPAFRSAVTHLTAALQATARREPPVPVTPAGLPDDELLALATRNDPSLLAPFQGLQVRVARTGRDAVLLVCSADGRRALAEDAGCTTPIEHDWACEGREVPCALTDAADSCFGPTDLRGAAPAP